MLSLIGLGLRDGDITQRGVKALERADIAYAELYTNAIDYDLTALEGRTGTTITVLDREQVEDQDTVLDDATDHNVVFLVSGDPLTATTHQDILFRARQRGIDTEVMHAPSIFTAIAETGLSIYKFGRTTTLTVQNGEVPESVFEAIEANQGNGLHTLVLVDPEMDAVQGLDEFAERVEGEVLVCSGMGAVEQEIFRRDPSEIRTGDLGEPVSLVVSRDSSGNERERVEQRLKSD